MGFSIKSWVGLAAFVAVIIVLLGWLLVISPTRAATADTRANIESESNRAITLTTALETLKTQYAGLDASRAELEEVLVQVPTTADAAAFRRVIVERAATSGVTITSLQTGDAAIVTEAPAAAPATTDENGDAVTATPSATPEPDAAASSTAAVTTSSGQTLVGIPLQMSVIGTYSAARAFIASLQGTEGRLYLVYGLNITTQPDSPTSGGRPATVLGDVEVAVQGYLLVLTADASDTTTTEVTPSPEPLPSTERNPFAPLAPTAPVG